MAKLYGEIAKSALLTLDKSFSRALGQPLDASEVYYSLDAAKTYAATPAAYIGQKIVVIEDGKITHYSVEDTAGNLKELGSKPVGDEKSIVVAENGTISLKGVGSLAFERDILGEDDQPTGEKETVQYQPLMTKDGLVWVEPSKTTVEGLATLIDALTKRVDDAEADIDALQEAVGVKASEGVEATGLYKEIADAKSGAEQTAADALAIARTEISKEIDDDVKVAKDRADEAYTLADGKVDAGTYATDKKALQDEDAAIREIAENVRDAFNTFMNSEEIDTTVNTLKELQAEIDKMTDATELANALASKADKSVVDAMYTNEQIDTAVQGAKDYADGQIGEVNTALVNRIKALEDVDNATQDELDAYKLVVTSDIATAKGEATGYTDTKLADYYDSDEVDGLIKDFATNKAVEDAVAVEANRAKAAEKVNADAITAIKDDANIDSFADVVAELAKKQNTGDYATKTEAQGYANAKDAAITEAHNLAQTGVDNAATAQQKANEAYTLADSNKTNLNSLTATVSGHTDTISEHTTKIANLGTFQTEHTALYDSLKGTVDKHTTDIAGKAAQSDLESAVSRVAANEAAIKTLNETTIPNINSNKANKEDVYTKTQIGTLAKDGEGKDKTIVQMIEDAKSAAIASATYNDDEVKEGIENNASLIETLVGNDTGMSVRAIAANEIAAQLVAEDAAESLDTLQEIAAWIQSHPNDAAAMNEDIGDLQAIVAGIGGENQPATVLELVEQKIAAIPLANLVEGEDGAVTATEGLILPENDKFEMADGKVTAISTDLLVQGKNTLILFGGSASV